MASAAAIPLGPLASDMPTTTAKNFIGAVEDEWQLYSDRPDDYSIGAPIGFGASSIVYTATYQPSTPGSSPASSKPIPCALKVLDLDSLPPKSLTLLQRETTLMSLSKHPNVLRVRGSWVDGHKLYIALRLMNKGSAADVMHYGWPGGMEEDVVRCILRQTLKGLNYLHINGFIHRDVKAANLLIDDDGTVLLGDLGVAADLSEDTSYFQAIPTSGSASRQSDSATSKRGVAFDENTTARPALGKRKSFVGTPCWMAPELIQGKQYDSSADIWSFGITALELAQGRPPRSRESPQRVLLKTIQEEAPTLDRDGGTYKYSRAFKEMVDSCLNKDPSKRPSAEDLLKIPFFKSAKKKSYLIDTILKNLPPLTERQERRLVPPVRSANSVDSWDFASTIGSPTNSIYRRRVLEDFATIDDGEDRAPQSIHSALDLTPGEQRHHSYFGAHSRHVSITEHPVPEEPENEVDTDAEDPTSPSLPSTSSSSNRSSVLGDGPINPETAPSSYTAPSELTSRHELSNKAEPSTRPAASLYNADTISAGQVVPTPAPPSAPVEAQSSSRPTSSSGGGAGLWKKFKLNVKGSTLSLKRETSITERGTKDTPKNGRSSMLSTAGRSLLSKKDNK